VTVETPQSPVGDIASRAKAILTSPKTQWPVIAGETISSGDIFTRYAMPLAAIGPVAGLIGSLVMGHGAFGIGYRPSFMAALSMAVTSFILSLGMLFVMTFIANRLAPRFGGEESTRRAFKLVAHAMTAAWIAGIFMLIPALAPLGIVGLYSVYLFHVGAGPLMKIPADQAMNYTAVNIICGVVLALVIGSVSAHVGGLFRTPADRGGITISSDGDDDTGGVTIDIPGVGRIDTGDTRRAAQEIAAAANGAAGGAAAPSALQALLPEAIGGYRRTGVSSARAGPGSQAEGIYEGSDRRFTLKVSDIAIVGALSGLGAAMGIESNRDEGSLHERTSTQGGNLVVEKWDSDSKDGRYMTVVDKRFLIEAEGEAASLDELKAATATIDRAKLGALARR